MPLCMYARFSIILFVVALAFLRRNLEDFSGHTVRDVEKCDILPTVCYSSWFVCMKV